MAKIPTVSFPKVPVRYPSFAIDSAWGTTYQLTLKRTQGVVEYDITVSLGTLSGGTTPAFAVTAAVPAISHFRIDADNTTIHDYDAQMSQEYEKLSRGGPRDGLNFQLAMCDVDYHTAKLMEVGVFPSFAFSQNTLYLTLPALSAITTGSPSSSSGTNVYVTEIAVPRTLLNFKPILVKKLQVTTALGSTGDNIFATLLPQTGAYKAALFFINSGSSQAYGSGSNSIVDYIRLKLNDTTTDTESWWAGLQSQDQAVFTQAPDTGYAVRIWMSDNDTSKLLALGDTRAITGIELDVHTTNTGFLTLLKILYA